MSRWLLHEVLRLHAAAAAAGAGLGVTYERSSEQDTPPADGIGLPVWVSGALLAVVVGIGMPATFASGWFPCTSCI